MRYLSKILIIFVLFINFVTFISIKTTASEIELTKDARSAILIEASTGEIVYEKNSKEALVPASMTKIMTMILVMEAINNGVLNINDTLTASDRAKSMGGTTIYLETGEKMTVKDLLKGVAITSANDAAVCLAEGISGSVEEFVKKMNDKALKLGCINTHFNNCNGLPTDNHYSCAYDMALMSKHLINLYPEILEYTSIYEDYLRKGTDREFWLVNTNKLVKYYDEVDGLKTGWTVDAGYCLSATQKKNDIRFIAVAMGCSGAGIRNKEIMSMLEYGANNYELKTILKEGEIIDFSNNILYKPFKYNLVCSEDINIINKKGNNDIKIYKDIEIYENINNGVLGKINIKINQSNRIIEKNIDIVSDEKVERANVLEIMSELIKRMFL